ncbi:MAG: CHASE2 domain-containing protein [Leptolyngbyaceae cyanobacterium]
MNWFWSTSYTPQRRFLYAGIFTITVLVLARYFGALQGLELKTFDWLLRWRPTEGMDERITIVEVTDGDIQAAGAYPLPNSLVVEALQQIQSYEPNAIGLDIFRDFPTLENQTLSKNAETSSYQALIETVLNNDNIYVVDRIIPPTIAAPPDIPLEQVGFADAILDNDGVLRRSLLGNPDINGQYRFSFTILLASHYLAEQGFVLANSPQDPVAMQFDTVTLASAHSRSRSYVTHGVGLNPVVLINFRSGSTPFRKVSLGDLLAGDVAAEWFSDRVVLIGVTARSAKDFVNSNVAAASNPGLVSGVEIQAHAISQILGAVLEDRPILKTMPAIWEYGWIILWGLIGIGLSRLIRLPLLHLVVIVCACACLFLIAYLLLLQGWWLPIVPAGFICFFNGVVLYSFYWYGQYIKQRIKDRQRLIDQTYSIIHNGPLQTLAYALQITQTDDYSHAALRSQLERLNLEMRTVYKWIRQGPLAPESQLHLIGELAVDLTEPLDELLYQVYNDTLRRDLPCFASIKLHVNQFEPMTETGLSSEQKQGVAVFFEEALCNVGRHAKGATRLKIICKQIEHENVICVADNGVGISEQQGSQRNQVAGEGTRQAIAIAQALRGTFQRYPNDPAGTVCELRWPVKAQNRWPLGRFGRRFGRRWGKK